MTLNELLIRENTKIEDMIFEIRGKQVMLVSSLASLYNTETRIVNQTIRRNIIRFPEEFCFRLTIAEFDFLKSQFVISKVMN